MSTRLLSSATAAIVLLAACQPATPVASAPTAEDSTALRDLGTAYATAWNARDAASIAAMMTSEYHEVTPTGLHHSSAAEAQAALATEMAQFPEGATITITTAFTKFIDGSHAYSGGTYTTSGMPAGMPTQGSWLVVNVKDSTGWRMAAGLGSADVTPLMPMAPAN
jgi:uncharacterized protein (TIGR02246 family)